MRIVILLFLLSCWTWDTHAQVTNLNQLEFAVNVKGVSKLSSKEVIQIFRNGRSLWPSGEKVVIAVSYTHLTLPTNREV